MAALTLNILDSCCVCLSYNTTLMKLSTCKEGKDNLRVKLTECVKEIDWLESYLICRNCMEQLEIVFSFRLLCFQSHERRHKLIQGSQSDEYHSGDLPTDRENIENEEPVGIEAETLPEIDNASSDDDLNVCNDHTGKTIIKTKITGAKRNNNFVCDTCKCTYNSSKKLIEHCVVEHEMDGKDVKPFACKECPNRFQRSSNLHQHMKYHRGNRNHMCSYCGKGFVAKCDLIIHEKQHLNKREYKCPFCPKSFNTHKDLRSHKLVVHTDPSLWTYVCNVCDKRFPIKSNYDSHMRRHNNDKPFACHLCEKRFSDKCVLQKHLRSHSEVTAYKCRECHKEYKDKWVMESHMAKIHNVGNVKRQDKIKKFFCHMCPKSYFIKSRLTRHLYSHSGEKPFMCTFCDKKFSDKSYVKIHMKSRHDFVQESS